MTALDIKTELVQQWLLRELSPLIGVHTCLSLVLGFAAVVPFYAMVLHLAIFCYVINDLL